MSREQASASDRPRRGLSLHSKFFVWTAMPIGVVLAALLGLGLFVLSDRIERNVEEDLTRASKYYALLFDSYLLRASKVADETAAVLSTRPDLKEAELFELLQENLRREPLVYGSAIAFEPGALSDRRLYAPYVYRQGEEMRRMDIAEAAYDYTASKWDWFNLPRTLQRPIWTEPYFDESAGGILMSTYAVPVMRQGRFVAVVTIDIPLHEIGNQLQTELGALQHFMVLSNAGRFVYNSYAPELIGERLSAVEWYQERGRSDIADAFLKLSRTGHGILRLRNLQRAEDGAGQWLFYAPISAADWFFIAGIDENRALRPVRNAIFAGAALVMAVVALMLVVTWLAAGSVTRRVAVVQQTAVRIADGDLSARTGIRSGDEIGRLAGAVDAMAASLGRREREIIEMNQGLEAAVSQRTQQLAEKTEVLETVFRNMNEGIVVFDESLKLLAWNDHYFGLRDYPPAFAEEGRPFEDFARFDVARDEFGKGNPEEIVQRVVEQARISQPHAFERQRPDGTWIEVRGGPIEGGGFVSTYADITNRKRAEEAVRKQSLLVQLLHETAVAANQAREPEDALRACIDAICSYNSWPVGHAYLCPPNTPDLLVSTNIWHLDDPDRYADFRRISEQKTFPRGVGLPGRVLASGEPAWIVDVAKDPNFPRAELAEATSLKTGFAVPVLVGDEIVAVMEFFASEAIDPDDSLLSTLDNVGTQLGRVVERKRAQDEIVRAHRLITESVEYASNIQRSLLPSPASLAERFEDHFVLWEPRDVVGGDFYWFRPCRSGHLLIVCDCTGHGVPGAFMTMIGTAALNFSLGQHRDGDPAALLTEMNRFVQRSLLQDTDEGHADDGMELGICRIARDGRAITYAGARFSLVIVQGGEVREIRGDKTGIGYRRVDPGFRFSNHEIETAPDMTFYLYTDGITDQIGGEKRHAFGRRRLLRLLSELDAGMLQEQAPKILGALNDYQGDEDRRDDVTLVGFKLNASLHQVASSSRGAASVRTWATQA